MRDVTAISPRSCTIAAAPHTYGAISVFRYAIMTRRADITEEKNVHRFIRVPSVIEDVFELFVQD